MYKIKRVPYFIDICDAKTKLFHLKKNISSIFLVRKQVRVRLCPKKGWSDHPKTGLVTTGTISGVAVSILKWAPPASQELCRKNRQKRPEKLRNYSAARGTF